MTAKYYRGPDNIARLERRGQHPGLAALFDSLIAIARSDDPTDEPLQTRLTEELSMVAMRLQGTFGGTDQHGDVTSRYKANVRQALRGFAQRGKRR